MRREFPLRAAAILSLAILVGVARLGRAADKQPPAPTPQAKVLVLTGYEYPGHKWRQTAPLIAQFLMIDPRLTADMITDPAFLASPQLAKYDVVVLNYLNYRSPDPGAKARANLQQFVAGGKGLVIVHNACGAFQDWPEFKQIAGRAWNPQRVHGHDPLDAFEVKITGSEHPITKGLPSFTTTDELYTCLYPDGRPVEVLATAMSVVEKKEHPMALVNHYGKGRVFLCVLGHDVQALQVAPTQELYRRGTAWAAGLTPVGPPVAPQKKR
jgi:type 1 glutamine amidotransferase